MNSHILFPGYLAAGFERPLDARHPTDSRENGTRFRCMVLLTSNEQACAASNQLVSGHSLGYQL